MKVSVIIPVFNVEKYLAESIESALNQTYKNIEVIAINDGSTDNSLQILESFRGRIKILTQENKGPAVALNRGIRLAEGDAIALLDGDDIWTPTKTERQVQEFMDNPELKVTFGKMEQFVSPELTDYADKFQYHKGQLLFQSKITALFRKEVFETYGLFAEDEILEFIIWFDAAKSGGIVFNQTEEVVAYRRIRENSFSQNIAYYPSLLRFLKGRIGKKRTVS